MEKNCTLGLHFSSADGLHCDLCGNVIVGEHIQMGSSETGRTMMVMMDGEALAVSLADFMRLVDNQNLTQKREEFVRLAMSQDFQHLEDKIMAFVGGSIRGIKATIAYVDDLYAPKVNRDDEPDAVPNKPNIKTNKRSKGKGHPLPFYLGSKRRY